MHSHLSALNLRASLICYALLTPIWLLCLSVSAHAQESKNPNPFPGNSGSEGSNAGSTASDTSRAPKTSLSSRGFELNLEGYMQVRYQQIENDEEVGSFIGRNDGFGLSNARVNLDARRVEKMVQGHTLLEGYLVGLACLATRHRPDAERPLTCRCRCLFAIWRHCRGRRDLVCAGDVEAHVTHDAPR